MQIKEKSKVNGETYNAHGSEIQQSKDVSPPQIDQ